MKNKETWNVDKGLDGLAKNETKLVSYHNTPFNKVCLGMTENDVTNWILVNYTSTSLYSVIADGNCRKTNVGRKEWMSLINDAWLQSNCSKEGFNVYCSWSERKLRIGILGNENDDCSLCDSVIGFGIEITTFITSILHVIIAQCVTVLCYAHRCNYVNSNEIVYKRVYGE